MRCELMFQISGALGNTHGSWSGGKRVIFGARYEVVKGYYANMCPPRTIVCAVVIAPEGRQSPRAYNYIAIAGVG